MSFSDLVLARWDAGVARAWGPTALTPASVDAVRPGGSVAFEHVERRFASKAGAVTALKDVNATIGSGEIFGVIGRSGAGKSTLLRLVNRLERPTDGRVLVDGRDIAALDKAELVTLRRSIGMVFQLFNLLSAKTVGENIALPLLVAGVPKAIRRHRVDEVLSTVGLEDKRNSYPSRLSGGQKQRVGIARALISGPRILLCDEATSALDPETTLSILDLLKDINRRLGITIVLITHEMSVIRAICDQVLVLERGKIAEIGAVGEVFGNPQHDATRVLLRRVDQPLPDELLARLVPRATPGRRHDAILSLRYSGHAEPDLSQIAARFGGPVRLLNASLDGTSAHTQVRLVVAIPTPFAGTLPNLSDLAFHLEVLGYVAAHD